MNLCIHAYALCNMLYAIRGLRRAAGGGASRWTNVGWKQRFFAVQNKLTKLFQMTKYDKQWWRSMMLKFWHSFQKLCAARDVNLKSVFKKTMRCARYEQNLYLFVNNPFNFKVALKKLCAARDVNFKAVFKKLCAARYVEVFQSSFRKAMRCTRC